MTNDVKIKINQNVAILIDGNNIERSIHSESNNTSSMLNIDELVPELLKNRQLNRMVYFREGKRISEKLQDRFQELYHGSVRPCHKSADIPITIKATQLASKVDTIIIMSGDSDFVELVTHLQAMGVRVEIAAVRSTTSQYLLDVADQFHEITNKHWFSMGQRSGSKNRKMPKTTTQTTSQTDEQRKEQSQRDKERNKSESDEKTAKKVTKKKATKKKATKKKVSKKS